jgi:hypothetical protein
MLNLHIGKNSPKRCPKCDSTSLAEFILPRTLTFSNGQLIWQRHYRCVACEPMDCFVKGCEEKGRLFIGFFDVAVKKGERVIESKIRNDKFLCARHAIKVNEANAFRATLQETGKYISYFVIGLLMVLFIILVQTSDLRKRGNEIYIYLGGAFVGVIGFLTYYGVSKLHILHRKLLNLAKKPEQICKLSAGDFPEFIDDWF